MSDEEKIERAKRHLIEWVRCMDCSPAALKNSAIRALVRHWEKEDKRLEQVQG